MSERGEPQHLADLQGSLNFFGIMAGQQPTVMMGPEPSFAIPSPAVFRIHALTQFYPVAYDWAHEDS